MELAFLFIKEKVEIKKKSKVKMLKTKKNKNNEQKYQDPDVGLGFFRGVDGFSKNIHTFFRPFFRSTKMIVHANIYEKALFRQF